MASSANTAPVPSNIVTGNEYFKMIEIGPGFYTIRDKWMHKKVIDISNHMSFAQLSNGNFVVLDTIRLSEKVVEQINELTNNGEKIEAVITTHPFHSSYTKALYELYPKAEYYGTIRHMHRYPEIPWKGNVQDCKAQGRFYPDLEMRVTEGAEFVNPRPERDNHLASLFVFHKASRTLHVCDTIFVGHKPNVLLFLGGYRHRVFDFHPSLKDVGLIPNPDSPFQLRDFVYSVASDWDFDNICAAHFGYMIGGAKAEIYKLLAKSESFLEKMSKKFAKKKKTNASDLVVNGQYIFNIEDNECECG